MPGITIPARRRREDSDDEESESSGAVTPASSSKRQRRESRSTLDTDDGSSDVADQDEDGASRADGVVSQGDSQLGGSDQDVGEENGGEDAHPPGSIVKVKLTNFVTYTDAQFTPGPKLNMIIGPNGTGKSTLVCAICLGLGFGTSWLGRAKEVSEFVKHGANEATVEIELARNPNVIKKPGNITIKRRMIREGNKSAFWVNGQPSTMKLVSKLCQKLSIQVDNLCQFLPQEKVSEFARMDPVFLLHETQRAVCKPEMVEYHDNLKALRKEQKGIRNEMKVNKVILADESKKQERAQADVERIHERDAIQRKVKMLEKCRPVAKYHEAQRRAEQLMEVRNTARAACETLKREVEPALRAVNAKQEYRQACERDAAKKKAKVEKAAKDASVRQNEIVGADDMTKSLEHDGEQIMKKQKARKEDEKRAMGNIKRFETAMAHEPEPFDAASYNERIRAQQRIMDDLRTQSARDRTEQNKRVQDRDTKAQRIRAANQELERLDSQAGKQELKLRQLSQQTELAWKWIQENKDKFEAEVFGPPVVTCSVKDPKYTDALESLFQKNDFIAFTVQTLKDFRTLQHQLSTEMRLHEPAIIMCSATFAEASLRTHGLEQFDLRAHGFDGWALDYIAGPEKVLAMLCNNSRLHMTPIGLRDISTDEFETLQKTTLGTFIAGKTKYMIKRRREYNAMTTQTNSIRGAAVWTNQPVDIAAKRDLQDNIAGWTEEHRELERVIEVAREAFKLLPPKYKEAEETQKKLSAEKADRQTEMTKFRALPEKRRLAEDQLAKLQEDARETREQLKGIVRQIDDNALSKARATLNYLKAVERLHEAYEEYVRAELRSIEALSDEETLKTDNADINNRLIERQNEAKQATDDAKVASNLAKSILEVVRKISADNETREVALEVAEMHDAEQLEAEIESHYARLEIVVGGGQNKNTLRDYEERRRRIEHLTGKVEGYSEKLEAIAGGIVEIRALWEPELDQLAARISDAFGHNMNQIGCAGQVSIYKADDEPDDDEDDTSDFERWGIHIRVKFRETESLQLLTAHRQSGGERSVSTIFYLMALQSLSASPFRVVDEINQGMDPRNERKVHERMVDIACDRGGSQYFLITPKLLTGLKYKRGMNVHCIVSGEYVPKEAAGGNLDFGKCVDLMRGYRSGKGVDEMMKELGTPLGTQLSEGIMA